jgi:hypothetical protein
MLQSFDGYVDYERLFEQYAEGNYNILRYFMKD